MENKEKHLSYYRAKFKDNFSPAMLEFHLNKLYDQSVKSYNPDKAAFNTHLAAYMQKLNRVSNYRGGLLKLTEYGKSLNGKVMKEYQKIKTLDLKTPEPEDIAKNTGIPVKKVQEILKNNTHAAIVPGVETAKLGIDTGLLSGLDDTEQKVLHTIEKDMPPEKAYAHTGLAKTKYYEVRNSVRDKLRKAYINTLKANHVVSGS